MRTLHTEIEAICVTGFRYSAMFLQTSMAKNCRNYSKPSRSFCIPNEFSNIEELRERFRKFELLLILFHGAEQPRNSDSVPVQEGLFWP
jgi:hypothetical protein